MKLPKLPLPQLGPTGQKIARYIGIGVFGVITFVFALQLSLPVERMRDKVVEALSPSYDVSIGKVERGWLPGRVYFKKVQLRSRQTKPNEPVTEFFIDKLEVDVGLFAALRGNLSIDLDAQIEDGRLYGNVTLPGFGKKGLEVHMTGKDLPADALPLRGMIGLPMTGKLELAIALDLPNENRGGRVMADWQKAEGSFEFSCPNKCTFGDGHTKLKPLLKNTTNQVMVGEGIDFGKVDIDTMSARADLHNGNFDVTKFETSSRDGELHVDYHMKLEADLMESMVTGCLRFKGSDELLKKEPKTYAAIQTTGAERRADGLFHITLADHLRDMKRLNQECGPNVSHPGATPERPPARPQITVMPDEPKPGAGSAAPAPQPGGGPQLGPPPGIVMPGSGSAGSAAAPGSAGAAAGAGGAGEHQAGAAAPTMARPAGPEGEGAQGSAAGSAAPPGAPNEGMNR